MKLKSLLFVLLLSSQIFGQWESFQLFDVRHDDELSDNSILLDIDDNHLIMLFTNSNSLYSTSDSLFCIHSFDNGSTWVNEQFLSETRRFSSKYFEFGAAILNSGRIWIYFKSDSMRTMFSDDSGEIWVNGPKIPVTNSLFIIGRITNTSISQSANGNMYFTYSSRSTPDNIFSIKSTDEGESWQTPDTLITIESTDFASAGYLKEFSDGSQLLIYTDEIDGTFKIFSQRKNAGSAIWYNRQLIYESDAEMHNLSISENRNGVVTISFEDRITLFDFPVNPYEDNKYISDIFYLQSSDGLNWSSLNKVTNYPGFDGAHQLSNNTQRTLVSFASDRLNPLFNNRIWYGEIGVTEDSSYSPAIYYNDYSLQENSSVLIETLAYDDEIIDSVICHYSVNDLDTMNIMMFDDGMNGDLIAGDHKYSLLIEGFNAFDKLEYFVSVTDNDLNVTLSNSTVLYIPSGNGVEVAAFNVNNIYLPLDNRGIIGYVNTHFNPTILSGGRYDGSVFLYSGGFFMSGYTDNQLWGNGDNIGFRVEDYSPGPVGGSSSSGINLLYQITSSDVPFGQAWQDWRNAAVLGANFYDGNGDGIYDPVDLNNNGFWDFNEDRPDFLGDQTAWCVYNDDVPSYYRYWINNPQGVEIHQTVFASDGNGSMYEDIIFVRYKIINTGTVTSIFDSVYFSAAIDPDLGHHGDDLVGCDTIDNSGYTYNEGPDDYYGINPPSLFVKQLQGAPVYLPGETYIDVNNDGDFSTGIDTPLDSAVVRRGKYLGAEFLPGAKNLNISSLTRVMKTHPDYGDPYSHRELRYYQVGGFSKHGEPLDPCTWEYGNSSSLPNCSELNPKFMYSGDPVTDEGWFQLYSGGNLKYMFSSGPFEIKVEEPVELIYAYIVGRGTDHLNSITVAREISQFAQTVYDNNFEDLPTGIDGDENLIADDYKLYQNYPNPFNPTTTIKFNIPVVEARHALSLQNISLKIFDILGREVQTLVNEQKSAGTYEVQFDASKLSSGVYFYQLKYSSFIQTKKLMLLK